MAKKQIGVGLIGYGYMGKAFTLAIESVSTLFDLPVSLAKEVVATSNAESAQIAARELGFTQWASNWREVVDSPSVDAIICCTPNHLHKDIAVYALSKNKPVLCEKPLAVSKTDAYKMVEVAEQTGTPNMAGYTYIKNPAIALAKEIVDRGEIGDIVHFRGIHIEDYMADPNTAMNWRLRKSEAGAGASGDLCHIINMAHYLCGEITEVVADANTVIEKRLDKRTGQMVPVETDDQTHILCRFVGGSLGYLELSRVASGKKMGLGFELTGSTGSIIFDQARMSEIQLYTNNDQPGRQGFRTLLLESEHPDYAYFNNGPGHGLGYNDMVAIEVRDFILGILKQQSIWPNFRQAYHTEEVLDAALESVSARKWVAVDS